MYTAAGGTSDDPTIPSGHTAGPGPAPLRAELSPLPQGLISVSEVEAKSPGLNVDRNHLQPVHIPGARPHTTT